MAKKRPGNPPQERDRAPVDRLEPPVAERSKTLHVSVPRLGSTDRPPFTDEEKALYFGAPEETPSAGRDAAILGLSRQAEEMGISVVNLLSETILAEHDVRRFERNGKTLDWRRFSRTIGTAQRLRRERSDIEKEARTIAEGPHYILGRSPEERDRATQDHQKYFAAKESTLEKRRRKLEEEWSALGVEWKALYVLPEIIQKVRASLECWRVRYALDWLRASRLMYSEEDLPPELTELLDLIGKKVARPKKYTRWKASEQERKVLYVWGMRTYLDRDAREKAARGLGFGSGEFSGAWDSLERVARRYVAGARAKEAHARAKDAPAHEKEPEDEP